jgi:hypothetical protein
MVLAVATGAIAAQAANMHPVRLIEKPVRSGVVLMVLLKRCARNAVPDNAIKKLAETDLQRPGLNDNICSATRKVLSGSNTA